LTSKTKLNPILEAAETSFSASAVVEMIHLTFIIHTIKPSIEIKIYERGIS